MQPLDERSGFRIRARVEHVAENEFVATATAIPDNGDPSAVATLTRVVPSLQMAREAARSLVVRMGEIVATNGGLVTGVETCRL